MTLLSVAGLRLFAGDLPLLRGVDLEVGSGERVGLIGESGSGKTLTALAIMGLLPEGLRAEGSIRLGAEQLLGAGERRLARLRGDRLAMVFQEPGTALDPLMRVGGQIAEAVRLHRRLSRGQARARSLELLRRVGFERPAEQSRRFPHQLSGGQRQRVMIAIALACDPELVLADEPTTALDVTVQAQVLGLLQRLVAEQGSALLLISHDLAVVSSVCQRIVVMYGGTVVETAAAEEIVARPRHPYTGALLDTSRGISGGAGAGSLPTIPGAVPAAADFPSGCVFRGRCPREQPRCRERPPLQGAGHRAACWFPLPPPDGGPGRVR